MRRAKNAPHVSMRGRDRFSWTSQFGPAIKVLSVVVIFVEINVHVIFVSSREFCRCVGKRILWVRERGEGDHGFPKEEPGSGSKKLASVLPFPDADGKPYKAGLTFCHFYLCYQDEIFISASLSELQQLQVIRLSSTLLHCAKC